ncbi:MAG: TetR/AcrR family transcriptional regulator [Saprospiraceae bacterium]|nr:TetR/AcrR family transcriptional regulator [Saprospiraceae bacterium]
MATREKILVTALQLFNEKGYVKVGVREIARALQMSPGNLSYHFPKKEDLLFELLKSYSEQNTIYFSHFQQEESSIDRFLTLMTKIMHAQYQHRGIMVGNFELHSDIWGQDTLNYRHTHHRRRGDLELILTQLRDAGQIEADADDIAFLVSMLTLFGKYALHESLFTSNGTSESEVVDQNIDLLIRQLSLFSTETGSNSIEEYLVTRGN